MGYLQVRWEKNIQLVDPYVYTDIVSIRMYLDELQRSLRKIQRTIRAGITIKS